MAYAITTNGGEFRDGPVGGVAQGDEGGAPPKLSSFKAKQIIDEQSRRRRVAATCPSACLSPIETKNQQDRMYESRSEPTHHEIAVCAYCIWEQEGRPEGGASDHWLQAELQLVIGSMWQDEPTRQEKEIPANGQPFAHGKEKAASDTAGGFPRPCGAAGNPRACSARLLQCSWVSRRAWTSRRLAPRSLRTSVVALWRQGMDGMTGTPRALADEP